MNPKFATPSMEEAYQKETWLTQKAVAVFVSV